MQPSQKPDFHPTIGREGETATFLSRCLLNSELREFGFAPRQLRRCAASFELETDSDVKLKIMAIRFYSKNEAFSELSNFSPHGIEMDTFCDECYLIQIRDIVFSL